LRWPGAWKDPAALGLLNGTAIDYLIIDKGPEFEPIRARARQEGWKVADAGTMPPGIVVIKGEWPGVQMRRGGGGGGTEAGPTGAPWVDSNGWNIRLAAALHPESAVWVDVGPPATNFRSTPDTYLLAVADAAAYGGRWIITLDDALASRLTANEAAALNIWKRIATAAGFFADNRQWADYSPLAVVAVVSDFAGGNEFFNQELLNLLARAGQHFRVVPKASAAASSVAGLRAVIYADAEAPPAELRKQVLAFVEAGGMLITGPKWGSVPGTPVKGDTHPRYALRSLGKGRIAAAIADPDDPWLMANDSVVLVSHRYDLVRFWNGGATGSFVVQSPDRKKAIAHLIFYANRGPDAASVRVAGSYRTAKAATVDIPVIPKLDVEVRKDAIEVHLPLVNQYVALELEG
jgi:hypothetical protein